MAYIPLIKETKWIDLSKKHKKLRETIEQNIEKAIKGENVQPIMVKGAFGIGKTNLLYYLFHYGWSILQTPTFYLSLDEIIKRIKKYAKTMSNGKISNSELSGFINSIIAEQIKSIQNTDWNKLKQLYFPELNERSLTDYLKDFQPVKIISNNTSHEFNSPFQENTILKAIESNHRSLVLIDEFESKFYELKRHIETSGGGALRELFDNIVHDPTLFYLVICNGPASGYEIAKERGEVATESETAANRRLNTMSIPFPTVDLLKQSFLKDEHKGYINLIWWLSRCRPGHILKLKESLGDYKTLGNSDFNDFITTPVFKESIDEGGEAVTYLRTAFFNDIPGTIQNKFLKDLILNLEPQQIDITKNDKEELKKSISYFYCAPKPVSTKDLLSQLHKDIYESCLKKYQNEGKFGSVNYIEHIQPYFCYILDAISNEKKQLAFGMINDSKSDKVLADIFLKPLLELTYDFISQYQDDSVRETKQTLDFLLDFISKIKEAVKEDDESVGLDSLVPNTFELFEKCKLRQNDQVYLQLSLFTIRESVEQPIGSPVLKYKNKQILECFAGINNDSKFPLVYYQKVSFCIYVIPELEDNLLKTYIDTLEGYLFEIFYDRFHRDGHSITRIIYFSENKLIEEFKNKLIKNDGEDKPAYTLKKIDVINIKILQLNFESQMRDYIDSVSKIGIIGVNYGELKAKEEYGVEIINLKKVIEVIGERSWTDKRETIRTIEHYRKLLFDGDNSAINNICILAKQEYKAELENRVCCDKEFCQNVNEYGYLDEIATSESGADNKFSTNLALLYLIENKSITDNDPLKKLLSLIKEEYKIKKDKDDVVKKLDFGVLLKVITEDNPNLQIYNNEFDLNSSFLRKLYAFVKKLLCEDELKDIVKFYKFIDINFESHWIQTYHEEMGSDSAKNLTGLLYALAYIGTLDCEKLKNSIDGKVAEIEQNVRSIRTEIVDRLGDLQQILNEKDALSSYSKKLDKLNTGVSLIKNLLDENKSCSCLLIVYSLIEQLNKVLNDAKTFCSQLEDIYNEINTQKEKVDSIQEKIDEIYEDSLTKKLISFKYPDAKNNEYLWKETFLEKHLKQSDEYKELWGSKNYYNPFARSIIKEDEISKFNDFLIKTSDQLLPTFDETLETLREKQKMANHAKRLREYISELLNTEEND